jgi:creatinine amidohydrolase
MTKRQFDMHPLRLCERLILCDICGKQLLKKIIMKIIIAFFSIVSFTLSVYGQKLPTAWEEFTASDFVAAVKKSEGVCIVPVGVIEKHGQHLPLGTDVYIAREISRRAAGKEYCIVYPCYFVGQNFSAMSQPGTISYSSEFMFEMLDETCREIARNGIKKIILVTAHSGNMSFLNYFCQEQMESPKDYVVYAGRPTGGAETQRKIREMRKSPAGEHADEVETSTMMAIRPDLVKIDRAASESGVKQNLSPLAEMTGLRFYAQYPNHYAGDAKDANAALGEINLEGCADELVNWIKTVKADKAMPQLQDVFFRKSQSPLETKPWENEPWK